MNKSNFKGQSRITEADYIRIGKEHGVKLIGALPQNVNHKARWLCLTCKDEFQNRYSSLVTSGLVGCPRCTKQLLPDKNSLNAKDYRQLGQRLSLALLDDAPRCTNSPIRWQCKKCNQEFERTYESLRRCVYACANCAKKEKIASLLENLWSTARVKPRKDKPNSSKDSVEWICPVGHTFKTSADNILQGRACAQCGREKTSDAQRNKPGEYRTLAKDTKCQWLGPHPRNITQSTKWKCLECSYHFESTFSALKRAMACPKCKKISALQARKTKSVEYQKAAEKYGWRWLGPETENQHEFTNWNCPKRGHGKFIAKFSHLRVGIGCQKCGWERTSEKMRATESDYRRLAKQTRCNWIGKTVPVRAQLKTEFQCWGENKDGAVHTFRSSYQHLLRVKDLSASSKLSACTRCSVLRRQSKPQEAVYHLLNGLGRRTREKKIGKWWVDIVLTTKSHKIAIEYDGWHYHKNRQEKDRQKRKYLREQGFKTLRIKGGSDIPTKEQLIAAVKKLTESTSNRSWCEITLPGWIGLG